jgi:type III secretion protein V
MFPSWLRRGRSLLGFAGRYGDVGFAAVVAAMVVLMLVPVPPAVLDLLLVTNLAAAVLMLMVVVYAPDVTRLSSFPTVLLLATLFRLALNVNSVRLILGQPVDGDAAASTAKAGHVIEVLGKLVAGSDVLVGSVVFLVLTIVQLLVVAKGAERGSDVQARFTLDQVGGRQMAIDSDLAKGLISAAEAKRLRLQLSIECRLAGAMEGAMKFVKGDALLGVLLCAIVVTGGFLMEWRHAPAGKFEWAAALETYTLLTIGDGLVAQIPSLLMCLCAALIVTRVGDTADQRSGKLARDLTSELFAQPRSLAITATLLALLAVVGLFVEGFPATPFFVLGATLGGVAFWRTRVGSAEAAAAAAANGPANGAAVAADGKRPKAAPLPWQVPVRLTLGAGLATNGVACDPQGALGQSLSRELLLLCETFGLPRYRLLIEAEAGNSTACRLFVRGAAVATLDLGPGRIWLARSSLSAAQRKEFGAVAAAPRGWLATLVHVPAERRAAVEAAGLPVLSAADVLTQLVRHGLRSHLVDLFGLDDLDDCVRNLRNKRPELVDTLMPRSFTLPQLWQVMSDLLREQVPVRDLPAILAAMANWEPAQDAAYGTPTNRLETVRLALVKTLVTGLAVDGVVRVHVLTPEVEDRVRALADDDKAGDVVRVAIGRALEGTGGERAVVLTTTDTRHAVVQLLQPVLPDVAVLSMREYEQALRYVLFERASLVRLDLPNVARSA